MLGACEEGLLNSSLVSNHRASGGLGVAVLRCEYLMKVDHERMAEGTEPWTLVMSGPGLGEQGLIRAASSGLSECLEQVISRLRSRPGDWEWLADFA